jgi:hypothetical protein
VLITHLLRVDSSLIVFSDASNPVMQECSRYMVRACARRCFASCVTLSLGQEDGSVPGLRILNDFATADEEASIMVGSFISPRIVTVCTRSDSSIAGSC